MPNPKVSGDITKLKQEPSSEDPIVLQVHLMGTERGKVHFAIHFNDAAIDACKKDGKMQADFLGLLDDIRALFLKLTTQ